MGREIKFRIYDTVLKYMITPETQLSLMLNNGQVMDGENKIEDVILMQYTGLKDKNGVEVYEGDLVKANNYWFCSTVEYIGSCYHLSQGDGVCEIGTSEGFSSDELEIIGNIHENSDLM